MLSHRLQPLDALRGFIMLVMALDHANNFIAQAHSRPEFWSSALPTYPDALSFLTRFVTHLAAPGFFFLMGVGVTLFAESRRQLGWAESALTRHFLVRGLILGALQFLVENPAWQLSALLNGSGRLFPIYVGVLYGLGGALILAAFARRIPANVLAGLSLAALLLPEALIRFARPWTSWPWVSLLLVPAFTETLTIFYPILPWFGLTGFGLLFGRQLLSDHNRAYRYAFLAGAGMLGLFFLLRALGGLGNIRPAAGPGWIEFLTLVKYPPSLVFVLLALGVDLMLLALFAQAEAWTQPLVTFGRSPLFFYLAHLYLYGLLGFFLFPNGTSILWMYPVWLAGLGLLYFLCLGYGRFKARRPPSSLWRLA